MERSGSRLIIVCGLPGSGKTTRSKMLERRFRAIRLCPDDWLDALSMNLRREDMRGKVEALQWKLAQDLLVLGLSVIIEWGTWARSERDTLRLGARALGAAVELHYVSAPVEVLFDRLQRRGGEYPPSGQAAVSRWFELFQVPGPEEVALFDKPLVADLPSDSNGSTMESQPPYEAAAVLVRQLRDIRRAITKPTVNAHGRAAQWLASTILPWGARTPPLRSIDTANLSTACRVTAGWNCSRAPPCSSTPNTPPLTGAPGRLGSKSQS